MAEEERKVEAASGPAQAPARGPGKLVAVLLAVNTVAVLAVVALQVLTLPRTALARRDARADERPAADRPAPVEKRAGPAEGQPGPTLRLSDFIVHLRDLDADRYARVSFELEVPDEKAKESMNARLPQVRDAFLAYLSDRTTEDLRGSEAIGRVKGALERKVAEVAPGVAVRGLYVTELVVQ